MNPVYNNINEDEEMVEEGAPDTSRDLNGGALFLSVTAVTAFTVSCALPMWWFTTTELEGQMCSCGTGLWQANFTWGDDLTNEDMFEHLSCSASNALATKRCDAPWESADEARWRGHLAGAFSILAVLFALAATVCGWKGFEDKRFMRRAFWCTFAAAVLELATIATFTDSPVFENLGYYFGCNFSFMHASKSNYLVCHALGPSWAIAAVGTIMCSVAAVLYYFAFNPTAYLRTDAHRYSLFTEMFERQRDKPRFMAMGESVPPQDTAGPARRFLRAYGIPLMCMANLVLFLYSNLSTGATVEPHIRIQFPAWLAPIVAALLGPLKNGNVLELRDDVFNFTLVSSLRHFYEARAYALAFLIGVFSGVWPYAKIFAMLMLWFVPASERVRGRALHWIDVLGKWSLIDSFFLCLMAVGFGFDTDVDILGIGIRVKIEVRPGWGVYSFVIATFWSLLMSHYLTHVHRRSIERRTWTRAFLDSMKYPPHEALDSRPYAPYPRRRRFKCRSYGRILVWVLLITTFCVMLTGQLTDTFEFRFGGLAQLILPPENAINMYSLVRVGSMIPASAAHGGYFSGEGWNWFLAIQFFFLSMIMPLLRVVLLMVIWSVPMTLKTAKRLHYLGEFVSAWAALDVFLISIMAAVVEIGALSQEVLSSGFGPIESTLCEVLESLPPSVINSILHMVGLPSLDLSDGCALFRVDAVLRGGCWVLFVAILLSEVCSQIVLEFAEAAISERMAMLSEYHRVSGFSPRQSARRLADASLNNSNNVTNTITAGRVNNSSSINLVGRRGSIDDDDGDGNNALTANDANPSALIPSSNNNNNNADHDEVASTGMLTIRLLGPLRRLLSAQERGSSMFVGSWADFFYGPVPRSMWPFFVKVGIVRRVEWSDIGRDLHADLVEPGYTTSELDAFIVSQGGAPLNRRNGRRSSTRPSSSATSSAAQLPISGDDSMYVSMDGSGEDGAESSASSHSWVAESPLTRA